MKPYRVRSDGIMLAVRLTPRSSRDAVDGLKDGPNGPYVQARVRAVPEDGRANTALVELVADEIGVAKSTVEVTAGHTARLKSLHIKGDAAALEARVTAWLKRFA
ncbi:MAG: DUF167 family protein [Alphaproteobacteria bacterium]|nr:DUF167 family protein [Alphaproteobacteria bacterium]